MLFFVWMVFFLLTACSQKITPTMSTQTEVVEGTLRPDPSDTPIPSLSPTTVFTSTPTVTPTVTPTPVYYEVKEGDDMYGISFWYSISLDSLMTANPSVDPRAMGPGTRLLIPITPAPQTATTTVLEITPTPTPSSLVWQEPDCYSDAAGGMWCFMLVENLLDSAVENVSGLITITSGEQMWQELAYLPLNLLPAGAALPLVAYFQSPIPPGYSVMGVVDFFLPMMAGDDRYLSVEITSQSVSIRVDGRSAKIEGELLISEGQPDAEYLWVQATAFNSTGNVVGVRRWEAENIPSTGDALPFAFEVYSSADEIDHVDLSVEAHRVR